MLNKIFKNLLYLILFLIYLSKEILPESKFEIKLPDERSIPDIYPYSFSSVIRHTYNKNEIIEDRKAPCYFNGSLTSEQLIKELGLGWNLGNSFDAHDGFSLDQNVSSEVSGVNSKQMNN